MKNTTLLYVFLVSVSLVAAAIICSLTRQPVGYYPAPASVSTTRMAAIPVNPTVNQVQLSAGVGVVDLQTGAAQYIVSDQAACVGDASTTLLVDAALTGTSLARAVYVGTAGTVCGVHISDNPVDAGIPDGGDAAVFNPPACQCYVGVSAGQELQGYWTKICGGDAGTTAGSFCWER